VRAIPYSPYLLTSFWTNDADSSNLTGVLEHSDLRLSEFCDILKDYINVMDIASLEREFSVFSSSALI